jgi:hypothetical protein
MPRIAINTTNLESAFIKTGDEFYSRARFLIQIGDPINPNASRI